MNNLIGAIHQAWYREACKHDKPRDAEAFEKYINSMTPFELLQEVSFFLKEEAVE